MGSGAARRAAMLAAARGVAVASAVVVAACDLGGGHPAVVTDPTDAVDANAIVEHVVDGDTIDVAVGGGDERVRLIGIDTPETKRPDTPVECFGPEASGFTAGLLPVGTRVRLERDTVNRDDYGRLLAYVYRAEDGLFVNLELVRAGYATPLSIEPNTTYADLFVDAARRADEDDLGLWAACGQ